MKSLKQLFICFLLTLCFSHAAKLSAQTSEGHIYTVTTMKIPLEKIDEFLGNWEKYVTPTIKKNEYIVSEKLLTHIWGPEWTVLLIDEYKTWNDIDASDKRYEELFKAAEPDKDKRMEIGKIFTPYYNGHSDAIVMEQIQLTK